MRGSAASAAAAGISAISANSQVCLLTNFNFQSFLVREKQSIITETTKQVVSECEFESKHNCPTVAGRVSCLYHRVIELIDFWFNHRRCQGSRHGVTGEWISFMYAVFFYYPIILSIKKENIANFRKLWWNENFTFIMRNCVSLIYHGY